jgi:hypothetical protein
MLIRHPRAAGITVVRANPRRIQFGLKFIY